MPPPAPAPPTARLDLLMVPQFLALDVAAPRLSRALLIWSPPTDARRSASARASARGLPTLRSAPRSGRPRTAPASFCHVPWPSTSTSSTTTPPSTRRERPSLSTMWPRGSARHTRRRSASGEPGASAARTPSWTSGPSYARPSAGRKAKTGVAEASAWSRAAASGFSAWRQMEWKARVRRRTFSKPAAGCSDSPSAATS
mmetsp:Transcript_114051/g.333339  ORF Transcript_114051/g.333339 Transcript_114051/m.333339 type:complete len:200 (+) Transcript_114051:632-1231(+)